MSATLMLSDELVGGLQSQARAHDMAWQEWALVVLAGTVERSDQDEAWKTLNRRRLTLVHQKYHGGLDEAEERELAALQALADKHLETFDRQRGEWLRPFEELAQQLSEARHG